MQKSKIKNQNYKSKFKIFTFLIVILIFAFLSLNFSEAMAQGLSLSISPPLLEVMIMPGKEISQTFTITNDGWDGYAIFSLAGFLPKDEHGQILVKEAPKPDWLTLPDKVLIRSGEEKKITLKISPPENTPEKDYYFTLFYELDNQSLINPDGPTGNLSKAKIGANLLISVSKDGKPAKKARIVEFRAPKIIDSLQKLTYILRVENTDQHLFKPIGKIEVKNNVLNLAPVNVIAASTRTIPCLENEDLVDCRVNKKVLLGIYKATVTFSLDEDGQKYSAQTITLAFPFSLIFSLTTVYLIYLLLLTKKRERLNN